MLVLLSPSKNIKIRPNIAPDKSTRPVMLEYTKTLVEVMQGKSVQDVLQLMKISDKLAQLTVDRFAQFQMQNNNEGQPAIFTFDGDVYRQFEIEDFDQKELERAQSTVRILSGLYGILKPLDFMQPYRLEMGIRLQTKASKSLYEFWGNKIACALIKELVSHKSKIVINLASQEYAKAVQPPSFKLPLIEVTFLNKSKGVHKIIGFHAKKARGKMARWIVKNGITSPSDLADFSENGYKFDKISSSNSRIVFIEV